MKIIHSADWHWTEQRLDKCNVSASFVIDRSSSIRPFAHIIAGDYWDKRQVLSSSSAVLPAIEALKSLASISPVVMILGNNAHDAAGSLEIFRDLRTKFPVYVSERPASVALCMNERSEFHFEPCVLPDGSVNSIKSAKVIFHLLPYPTKSFLLADASTSSVEESNLLITEALKKIFLGFAAIGSEFSCPKILIAHCNVTGALVSSGQTLIGQDVAVSKFDLELASADYYALGHIHVNQAITPSMWYSGSIYHNNFGETERKYFNIVTFNPSKVKVEKVEIPSTPLSLHDVRLDSQTLELLDDIKTEDWEDAELRIRVHLTAEQATLIDDERIRERFPGAQSYHIERITIPEERLRSESIVEARTLKDKLKEWAFVLEKELPIEVFDMADEVESRINANRLEG